MNKYPRTIKVGKEIIIVKSYAEEASAIRKIQRLQGILYDSPQ